MLLQIPVLAKSDNRDLLAKQNSYCGDPTQWFRTDYFKKNGLYFTTFDFFINWSSNSFQPVAWQKRIILSGRTANPQEIMASITACDGEEYVENTKSFCSANGIRLEYILIPNISVNDWADGRHKVILFNPSSLEVSELSIMDLIHLIRTYKVASSDVKIGTEGLRYSTSTLETFLSKPNANIDYNGDAIYPGDADIVLFDAAFHPQIIIEIKKYNIGTKMKYKISLEQESIKLHLGDRYKYQSLDILQKHFDCELYMLFYPVTEDKTVKFEKIDNLQPKLQTVLPLPNINSKKDLKDFQARFFKFRAAVLGNTTRDGRKVYHTNYRCKYIPNDFQRIRAFSSPEEAQSMNYRLCRECQKT